MVLLVEVSGERSFEGVKGLTVIVTSRQYGSKFRIALEHVQSARRNLIAASVSAGTGASV